LLLGSSWGLGVLDDVESDSLGERSALANGHDIAELNVPEAGREVDSHVGVSSLESTVLLDKVKVITSDDDGSLHLHLSDNSGEDSATDRDVASEGTLLVDVSALGGLTGSLETKTDVLDVSLLGLGALLGVVDNSGLLLVSFLDLLGVHDVRSIQSNKKSFLLRVLKRITTKIS